MASSSSYSKKVKLQKKKKNAEAELKVGPEMKTGEMSVFRSPVTNPMLDPVTWDLIFLNLHSKDFHSVLNTCPEWNELLGSRKTTELFPLVLPHLAHLLEADELLACRGVTRTSKSCTEKLLETIWTSPELIFNLPNDESGRLSRNYSKIGRISNAFALEMVGVPNKLMKAICLQAKEEKGQRVYGASTKTPFFTRSLSLTIRDPMEGSRLERRRFTENDARLTHLLSRFGSDILRLNCTFHDTRRAMPWLNCHLREFYSLKILEVCETVGPRPGKNEGDSSLWSKQRFGIILGQLEHMELSGVKDPEITSRLIHMYGRQLRTLSVHGKWLEFTSIASEALPKLKKLLVAHGSSNALRKLSEMDWPLEILHIQLSSYVRILKESIEELVMQTVSIFKKTLTQLELRLENVEQFVDNCWLEKDLDEFEIDDENLGKTWFNKEDSIALANAVFKGLPNVQKVVLWFKPKDRDVVKSVIKRSMIM